MLFDILGLIIFEIIIKIFFLYREIVKMYIIPGQLLREFRKVSSNNRSPQDGRHVETLAYLIGYQSDGNLIGTDLVFPRQSATSSHVDDIGKYFCLIKF